MGKRILVQRKGYGHLWARSPSHRHAGEVKAPLARIKYEDGKKGLWLPPEGIYEGQEFIQSKKGYGVPVEVGNIIPLKKAPLGTLVFNIESTPQDGGGSIVI